MKKKILITITLIMFIVFSSGCFASDELKNENEQQRETINQLQSEIKELQTTITELQGDHTSDNGISTIKAVDTDPTGSKKWTKLSNFDFDYDMDGQDETLSLFTAAMRDEKGTIMWDDGQEWLLLLKDRTLFYPLFREYVQLGSVFFTVDKTDENAIPTISLIVTTGATLTIREISYSKDENTYGIHSAYESGVLNRFFTSMPDYR